jgi:hypothetical protein
VKFIPVILIVLASLVSAQSLREGSVVFELTFTNYGAKAITVFDFDVCCGELQADADPLNVFNITNGKLSLSYKNAASPLGYDVIGTLDHWLPSFNISETCEEVSATFKDVSVYVYSATSSRTYNGLTADYSQMVCQDDGAFWNSGGGITVYGATGGSYAVD